MNSGSIFGHELQEGRHEQIHSNRILVKKKSNSILHATYFYA